MSVWYCIPSKRKEAAPILQRWRALGYRVAIQRDPGEPLLGDCFDIQIERPYLGYAEAVNYLCRYVMLFDPDAKWIVTGGDDIEPDPQLRAADIAQQCNEHFGGTFGVMQPTGDREFGDAHGPYIDRVAGSPWMGREFCRRMYGGRGPLCEEYFHMGEDEELQAIASKLGAFWQRQDIAQKHNHWGRPRAGEKMAPANRMPDFLVRANSPEEWNRYKWLFAKRAEAGFPGHEPIP